MIVFVQMGLEMTIKFKILSGTLSPQFGGPSQESFRTVQNILDMEKHLVNVLFKPLLMRQ